MDKIVDYVLEKIREDYFIILGTNDMIDKFSYNFEIKTNIMMIGYRDGKAEQLRLFNGTSKEVVAVATVKKSDIVSIIKMITKADAINVNFKDIIGIELQDEGIKGGIYPIIAKTEKDITIKIQKIFRHPNESEIEKVETIMRDSNRSKKMKDDINIGYI